MNKIRADGEAIGTSFDQFLYLHSRLEGDAAKTTCAYAEEQSTNGTGQGSTFLAYLATVYGDPNKKARALQSLHILKQRDNESFASFLPRFETLLANAGGHSFQEEQRITYLRQTLNWEMRTYLVGANNATGTTYQEFVDYLQGVASDLASLYLFDKGKTSLQPTRLSTRSTRTDQIDWTPTATVPANSVRVNSSANKRRATWVNPEVIAYRREKSLCLRYGNRGYF